MQRVFLLVCLVVCAHFISAQNTIKGMVVDDNNQPIIGASVMENGASNAIVTDFDGSFEISVVEGTKLSIAMLGYRPVEQAAAQDMVVVLRKKVAFKAKLNAIPQRHFLLANYTYTFSDKSHHNVGLTYGWCHIAGVYINATLGVSGFHYKTAGEVVLDYTSLDYYYRYYSDWDLTNTHTNQRVSFNTGLMVRLGCPLYFMGGVGYCYYTRTYKATNGDWIKVNTRDVERKNAMTYQVGFLADIKGFSLMASFGGYVYNEHKFETSIGIGCALNGKKGGKK